MTAGASALTIPVPEPDLTAAQIVGRADPLRPRALDEQAATEERASTRFGAVASLGLIAIAYFGGITSVSDAVIAGIGATGLAAGRTSPSGGPDARFAGLRGARTAATR